VGIRETAHIAGKLYNGTLHSQTDPKEWDIIFADITNSLDFTFHTPLAKTAGDQESINIMQQLFGSILLDIFRTDPDQIDFGITVHTTVNKSLNDRFISIFEIYIFTTYSNFDLILGRINLFNHLLPVFYIRLGKIQTKMIAYNIIQTLLMVFNWYMIYGGDVLGGDN